MQSTDQPVTILSRGYKSMEAQPERGEPLSCKALCATLSVDIHLSMSCTVLVFFVLSLAVNLQKGAPSTDMIS